MLKKIISLANSQPTPMYQTKKIDLTEKPRHASKSMSIINPRELSPNSTLENYKKALNNIVRKLSRTPSVDKVNKNKIPERQRSGQSSHSSFNGNILNSISNGNTSNTPVPTSGSNQYGGTKYFINHSFSNTLNQSV